METGLELRILTDRFVRNYFKNGMIISVVRLDEIQNIARSKNIPIAFLQSPRVPKSALLYYIQQIQKVRLLKFTRSKSSIKLTKKYLYLSFVPELVLSCLVFVLHRVNKVLPKNYKWRELENVLVANKVTELIFAGYTGHLKESACELSMKYAIKIFVIQNSWKDLFINPYLPIRIDKMNVWSDEICELYEKLNPHAKKIDWIIDWHPRLIDLLKFKQALKEDFLANDGRKRILYICANPKVIPYEFDVVEKILLNIHENLLMVVRPNPQDSQLNRWKRLEEQYENCLVDEHGWYWDEQSKINFPLPAAEDKWNMLLGVCDVVVSVASTVTIEALLMHKKVINIVFGVDGEISSHLKTLTEAPYYEQLVHHPDVYLCSNIESLNETLAKILLSSFSGDSLSLRKFLTAYHD